MGKGSKSPWNCHEASAAATVQEKRFRIALSFPGEHRTFVERVAEHLATDVGQQRVLYDRYYEAEFARVDLDTYLQRLYHEQSELIAVFLCADYERKEWCRLEWRAIRNLISRKASTVMLLRFDDTEIEGLYRTDGYVEIRDRNAEEIAELILQRLHHDVTRRSAVDHVKRPLRVVHADTQSPPHRRLLCDLEKAFAAGELKDSPIARLVLAVLAGEQAFELASDYDPSRMIVAIQLSDEYFARVNQSAGERDWQRDFPQIATPILVGMARSLKRSADSQSLTMRLCTALPERLRLSVVWPEEPDDFNDLVNSIYKACLGATELESDNVLRQLKGLTVVGPK